MKKIIFALLALALLLAACGGSQVCKTTYEVVYEYEKGEKKHSAHGAYYGSRGG